MMQKVKLVYRCGMVRGRREGEKGRERERERGWRETEEIGGVEVVETGDREVEIDRELKKNKRSRQKM